ncbi:MAG: hypothetical protein K6C94_06550 [Candidatus Gastranaerophilales bacterium]|nr:hypothetical protein [Candidatus Gastranaerophilales bacterium]
MAKNSTNKFKVVFENNTEPVDQLVADTLITQLMVTLTSVGLRTESFDHHDGIIKKEKEHGSPKD